MAEANAPMSRRPSEPPNSWIAAVVYGHDLL